MKSSMIWGCQWDACLNWFLTNDEIKGYVTNSEGKGNYSGAIGNVAIATGSNPAYQLNNIYDMAGNVYDWTLEANLTNFRVLRGGHNSVSERDSYIPHNSYDAGYGTRSTLVL